MNLVRAEFLKLRKRRGLVALTAVLTIVPVLVAYAVMTILHATNPEKFDAAGGVENLRNSLEFVTQFGVIAAILVGATAGAGDLGAGVFRELVVTGRSRLHLFAARVPGGLAMLLPFVAIAVGLATTASLVLSDGGQVTVTAEIAIRYAAWATLATVVAFVLAVGVSSALGSRGTSIAILLAWQLALAPILLASGKLDAVLPNAALLALQPGDTEHLVSVSATAALAILAAWCVAPLAAGAWRTKAVDV